MNEILIGKGEKPVHLLAKYGNRHGLVADATGTGKTISLLVLAEDCAHSGQPDRPANPARRAGRNFRRVEALMFSCHSPWDSVTRLPCMTRSISFHALARPFHTLLSSGSLLSTCGYFTFRS